MELVFLTMPFIQQQYCILISSIYITLMLTQIRNKNFREKFATLEIHPELQGKLRLSRAGESRFRSTASPEGQEERGERLNLEGNVENLDLQSSNSFCKYEPPPSPPRPQRKKLRLSSYQLYKQQQKGLKQTHSSKISEWKSRFLSIKAEKQRNGRALSNFTRTNSYSEGKNLHKKQIQLPLTPLQEVVAFKPVEYHKFRSNFIKTSEGKRKMVDNNAYLRKLKTKIEFYSLSAIITERDNAIKHLSPQIKAIDPKVTSDSQCRGSTQECKHRTYVKYGKAMKFRSRNDSKGELQGCRPWSGFKEEFAHELNSYI